jgi:hypothetical protein
MIARLLAVTAAATLTVAAAPAAAQTTRALVVVGLGGTPEYRERFTTWAVELRTALTHALGIPAADVVVLAERSDAAPGVVSDRSTKDNVVTALGDLARRSAPQDRLLVVLIGHGTAQGDEGQFNLPGPDLSGEELAAALLAFPTQTVAVVHTGSAGGGFVASLSGSNRITLSATRTSRERNATEFAGYFVEALTGDGADLDKDDQVSLLEAFTYTRAEVARHYAEENELLTEHAVLDDNGDGAGSPDPGADAEDGKLANAFRLSRAGGAGVRTTDDPVLNQLLQERAEIQGRLAALRTERGAMSQEAYDQALEALLVSLALKTREIRAREGGGS